MSNTSLPSIDELLEDFADLPDWDERYQYLVDLGRSLPPLPPEQQTEANRVHGCMSMVWMQASFSDDPQRRLQLAANSDSLIVRGLIAILLSIYENQPAANVVETDPEPIFEKLGLQQHLSPNRRNGLYAMVERVRQLASAA